MENVIVNNGDIAWMMVSTLLVIMMAVPGLALFYGGLVRSKNMLSVLMQVLSVFGLIVVLWVVYGYSLAFGGAGLIIGDFSKVFLLGVSSSSLSDTFTANVKLPEYLFISFQSACTKFHLTETALLAVHDHIIRAISQQQDTCLCLLEPPLRLTQLIDYSIVLERLSSWFGLSGIALNWIRSYLTSRSFYVKIKDSWSYVFQLL